MRVVPERTDVKVVGVCQVCLRIVEFTLFENELGTYYEIEEIVNRWMDHQLNNCIPLLIDNPDGIGYS